MQSPIAADEQPCRCSPICVCMAAPSYHQRGKHRAAVVSDDPLESSKPSAWPVRAGMGGIEAGILDHRAVGVHVEPARDGNDRG